MQSNLSFQSKSSITDSFVDTTSPAYCAFATFLLEQNAISPNIFKKLMIGKIYTGTLEFFLYNHTKITKTALFWHFAQYCKKLNCSCFCSSNFDQSPIFNNVTGIQHFKLDDTDLEEIVNATHISDFTSKIKSGLKCKVTKSLPPKYAKLKSKGRKESCCEFITYSLWGTLCHTNHQYHNSSKKLESIYFCSRKELVELISKFYNQEILSVVVKTRNMPTTLDTKLQQKKSINTLSSYWNIAAFIVIHALAFKFLFKYVLTFYSCLYFIKILLGCWFIAFNFTTKALQDASMILKLGLSIVFGPKIIETSKKESSSSLFKELNSLPTTKIAKANLTEKNLPIYTILVPLYKESATIGQIIESLHNLTYPKELLDIKLLVEENDEETLEAIKLNPIPSHYQIVVVPNGQNKATCP